MAYCRNCKGIVQMTTKICPHCGGDFTRFFGPTMGWGEYTPETPEEAEQRKARRIETLNRWERNFISLFTQEEVRKKLISKLLNTAKWILIILFPVTLLMFIASFG